MYHSEPWSSVRISIFEGTADVSAICVPPTGARTETKDQIKETKISSHLFNILFTVCRPPIAHCSQELQRQWSRDLYPPQPLRFASHGPKISTSLPLSNAVGLAATVVHALCQTPNSIKNGTPFCMRISCQKVSLDQKNQLETTLW